MQYEDLTVTEVMSTSPLSANKGETVAQVSEDMRLADIRHLPIVDDEDRLLGILSTRDIGEALARSRGKSVRVDQVMTTEVLTVGPDTPAREATLLMLEHKIGSLPVVDGDSKLIGIVTETDFLRLVHEVLGGENLSVDDD